MTVRKRLITLVGLLFGGLLIICAIAINSAMSWSNDMHKIGEERVPGLLYLANMNTERMIIRGQTLQVFRYSFSEKLSTQFSELLKQREASWKIIDDNWTKFEALPRASERGRLAVQDLKQKLQDWKDIYIPLDKLLNEFVKCKDVDTYNRLMIEYGIAVEKMRPISDSLGKSMVEQMDTNTTNTLKMIESATTTADNKILLTAILLISAVGIGLVLSALTLKVIMSSLDKVQNGLNSFFAFLNKETNNIDIIDLNSKDEFGQMAYGINTNIEKSLVTIRNDEEFVKDVARFVGELKSGNMLAKLEKDTDTPSLQELKKLLSELQYYLEHTIARDLNMLLQILESYKKQDFTARFPNPYATVAMTVNELGDAISLLLKQSLEVGKNLENSSSTLIENVNILNTSANSAAASLEETAAALEEITSTVVNNANNVVQMTKYSNEVSVSAKKGQELARSTTSAMDEITNQVNMINDAITVIDQIAFQTNILSLNAAVEAATAGEAGKGFAVVAQEVRNLAARSAEAAKEIKHIVERATSKANEGKSISDEMIKGYEELLENITKTTEMIKEISNASKEQEAGITQINDAVTGLDQQTQQNASIASQTREIALQTDAIAKEIVADVINKEFIGKNDTLNKTASVTNVKTISKVARNTKQLKKETHSVNNQGIKVIQTINPTKSSDDEWEAF
ncbi:MAG: methyl-accepting chemotaxis protein [Campylobacterota bacterium]